MNNALNGMYGDPTRKTWATTVERIAFPQPPSGPAIKPVLSVSLSPRPDGAPHAVVALARPLRRRARHPSRRPTTGSRTSTPYSFFWPNGLPETDPTLTPPRTNVTGRPGLPVGTGITMMVYDVWPRATCARRAAQRGHARARPTTS